MEYNSLTPDDKVIFVVVFQTREQRQQYLKYLSDAGVPSTSLYVGDGTDNRYMYCYGCNEYSVNVHYRPGIEANNRDESYGGQCENPLCGYYVDYEPNYDDKRKMINKPNAIAFGNYFKGFQRFMPIDNVSYDIEILRTFPHYRVDLHTYSSKSWKKNKLVEYINNSVREIAMTNCFS